jgi:hypothetical protein
LGVTDVTVIDVKASEDLSVPSDLSTSTASDHSADERLERSDKVRLPACWSSTEATVSLLEVILLLLLDIAAATNEVNKK